MIKIDSCILCKISDRQYLSLPTYQDLYPLFERGSLMVFEKLKNEYSEKIMIAATALGAPEWCYSTTLF